MGDVNYLPLIEQMVWSYSRIKSFDICPYAFFMKYISGCRDSDKFFSTYGTWMHKIIELYYRDRLSPNDMQLEFLTRFEDKVRGTPPKSSTVTRYIEDGSEYLKNFEPLPGDPIDIEKQVSFTIDSRKFVGRLDYVSRDGDEIYLIDHKSADIKPRSGREKPTLKDEDLDSRLRQLYLYSLPIKEEYGRFPNWICFNCFRTSTLIKERFDFEAYQKAIQWALDEIKAIEQEEDFLPNPNYFYCTYICALSDECIYHDMICD